MSERLDPVDQAFQEIPRAWYESNRNLFLAVGIAYYTALLADRIFFKDKKRRPHLVSAGLYAIGAVADRVSTAKGLDASEKLRQANVSGYNIGEMNILLRGVKTSRDLNRNPRYWIVEGLGFVAAVAWRPVGVMGGIRASLVAMNNFRVARRANRIVELALTQESQSSPPPLQQ